LAAAERRPLVVREETMELYSQKGSCKLRSASRLPASLRREIMRHRSNFRFNPQNKSAPDSVKSWGAPPNSPSPRSCFFGSVIPYQWFDHLLRLDELSRALPPSAFADSCPAECDQATAHRLSAYVKRAVMSSSVGIQNSEIALTRFSPSRTHVEGSNSMNRML
jgi:hypothetical protein